MRKITTGVLLLAIIAALFTLTGCPSEPADPLAETGNWRDWNVSVSLSRNSTNEQYYSAENGTYTFLFDRETDYVPTGWLNDLKENYYRLKTYRVISSPAYGFEATVQKVSGSSGVGYGFNFLYSYSSSSAFYYQFELDNGEWTLKSQKFDGSWHREKIIDWTADSCINPNGQANRVKVATLNNGSITISVNGTKLCTFTPPANTTPKGSIWISSGVGYDDIQDGADPVRVDFTITKIQD